MSAPSDGTTTTQVTQPASAPVPASATEIPPEAKTAQSSNTPPTQSTKPASTLVTPPTTKVSGKAKFERTRRAVTNARSAIVGLLGWLASSISWLVVLMAPVALVGMESVVRSAMGLSSTSFIGPALVASGAAFIAPVAVEKKRYGIHSDTWRILEKKLNAEQLNELASHRLREPRTMERFLRGLSTGLLGIFPVVFAYLLYLTLKKGPVDTLAGWPVSSWWGLVFMLVGLGIAFLQEQT